MQNIDLNAHSEQSMKHLLLITLFSLFSFGFVTHAAACPGQDVCQCTDKDNHKHSHDEHEHADYGKKCHHQAADEGEYCEHEKDEKDGKKSDKAHGQKYHKEKGKRCPHTGKLLEPAPSGYKTVEDAAKQTQEL